MKYFYVLLISFLFTNCYVYKANKNDISADSLNLEKQIKPNGLYKINVDDTLYKIKAVKWEGDSLVVNLDFKENKLRKFYKKDIKEVKQRVFSKGKSDALTFGIYGGIAAIIILLIGK